MDLKSILPGTTDTPEHFWALVLEEGWVQAGIWKIVDKTAEVIAVSPGTAWKTEEELISATDAALSAAIQKLPEEMGEPTKTVFGVPSGWVSGGQIKEEHLGRIKKLCGELSLQPSGFVVLAEALAHLTKSMDGSPMTAVVLGITASEVEISVFRLGNLVGTAQVARSVSIAEDVVEGLTRFANGDPLPSRFLLYDGRSGELEEDRQALLQANWQGYDKLTFLHTPQVEIVEPDHKVLATALAGGAEMGEVSSVHAPAATSGVADEAPEEFVGAPAAPEDMGFVVGQDVTRRGDVSVPGAATVQAAESPISQPGRAAKLAGLTARFSQVSARLKGLIGKFATKAQGIKAPTMVGLPAIPRPGLPGMATKKLGLPALLVFLIVVVIGFFAWWLLPKATVTVYVSPKKLSDKMTVLVDPKAGSVDTGKKVLPGDVLKLTVSGEKTQSTTGTKTVGDKAKGNVQIRNGTSSAIRLPAGTILVSSNDLKFTLDTSASVSAAISPSSPGTANVAVTAGAIGSEYNLARDESFKVGNYPKSDVDAVALADFSGGSSREISAVSASDQANLEKSLQDELTAEVKEKLSAQVEGTDLFIGESIVATASSRSFSAKVGDEASTLKLTLSLNAKGLAVKKADLGKLAQEALKGKVPTGFVLRDEQINYSFDYQGEDNGVTELEAFVEANLLPELNPTEIAAKIAGKSPASAKDYLTSIPGFARAEILSSPQLPGFLGNLPRLKKNITVEIAAER